MYTLILTGEERDAFDWVGDRYATGDGVANILKSCLPAREGDEWYAQAWNEPGDVEFHIPEHRAWDIRELSEIESGLWPCFSNELAWKMQDFVDSIV